MTGVFPDIDTRFRYLTGKKKKKKGACEMELSSLLGDLDLAGSDEEKRRKDKRFILEYYEVRETHYPCPLACFVHL